MRIPAAVEQASARRVGSDVYVTLIVPSANIDKFTPADIGRIEVYGYTGHVPPTRGRFAELGTLVATVPIAPPPAPGGDPKSPPPTKAAEPVGATQGAAVTVRDTLTGDELVEPANARTDEPANARTDEPPNARTDEPLKRFYMAYPWSPRGRVGPPGSIAELSLAPLPDPPPSAAIDYSEKSIALTWEPSGGLIGFLLERALPEELLPFDVEEPRTSPAGAAPSQSAPFSQSRGPVFYNVYRATPGDPFAPPPETTSSAQPWMIEPPAPANPAPLSGMEFTDSITFGEERCYTVRAVRGAGPDASIGNASPPVCVRPIDTFAPATPSGLATVASEGGISLIWEPNTEPDFRGYLVLRGEAADATLQPLTPTPITEAAFRDAAVTPGIRYVYAVVAVDNRFPVPNVSAESTRIEETAR